MLLRKAYQFEQFKEDAQIQLSSNELIKPIEYHDASIERIISFIEANWRNNYSRFLK